MKAVFILVALALVAVALVEAQPPLPNIPAYWSGNLTETRTFQNQTRSNKAVRWNCNDGHKSDRVDSDTGRGPITFITRLDLNPGRICNIFTQGGTKQCRCRRSNANTTVDPFPWLKNSKVQRSGPAACPAPATGNCNLFSLDDSTVFGSPHKLWVSAADNASPVRQESGADQRKVTVTFDKFDKGHPDDKVFSLDGCPEPPME